ncbi:MAG: hypothetical protein ACOC1P_02870 [Minisyncoccales bacterium]
MKWIEDIYGNLINLNLAQYIKIVEKVENNVEVRVIFNNGAYGIIHKSRDFEKSKRFMEDLKKTLPIHQKELF